MGDILSLSKKLERARRNGTGFQVSADEVDTIFENEIADAVFAAKLRKLKSECHAKPARTSSEISGSINGETELHPTLGKSHGTRPVLDRSSIAALARNA